MSSSIQLFLFFSFFTTSLVVRSCAFPTGAASCVGDGPAVAGSHLMSSAVRGDLADYGVLFSVDGNVLDPNTPLDLSTGVAHSWTLSVDYDFPMAQKFRGFLVRLSGGNTATHGVDQPLLVSEDVEVQDAEACLALEGVIGATHVSNDQKDCVGGSLVFEIPSDNLIVDVTMVIENRHKKSTFLFNSFTIHAVASASLDPPVVASESVFANGCSAIAAAQDERRLQFLTTVDPTEIGTSIGGTVAPTEIGTSFGDFDEAQEERQLQLLATVGPTEIGTINDDDLPSIGQTADPAMAPTTPSESPNNMTLIIIIVVVVVVVFLVAVGAFVFLRSKSSSRDGKLPKNEPEGEPNAPEDMTKSISMQHGAPLGSDESERVSQQPARIPDSVLEVPDAPTGGAVWDRTLIELKREGVNDVVGDDAPMTVTAVLHQPEPVPIAIHQSEALDQKRRISDRSDRRRGNKQGDMVPVAKAVPFDETLSESPPEPPVDQRYLREKDDLFEA